MSNLIPAPPEKTDFWPGTEKILIGGGLLFAIQAITAEIELGEGLTKEFISMLGPIILIGGIHSLFDNALIWCSKYLASNSVTEPVQRVASKKRKKNWRNTSRKKQAFTQIKPMNYSEIYYKFKKYQSILACVVNLFSVLLLLGRYCNIWSNLPNDVSIFSLSFPESLQETRSGPVLSFLHMPLIIPIFTALALVGLAYNFNELIFTMTSDFPRQNDSPFFGALNVFSYISATAWYMKRLLGLNTLDALEINASFGEDLDSKLEVLQQIIENLKMIKENQNTAPKMIYFVLFLNKMASYQTYKNILSLFYNVAYAFINKPKIEVENLEKSESDKSKPSGERVSPVTYEKATLFQSGKRIIPRKPNTNQQVFTRERIGPKIKTRGKPGEKYKNISMVRKSPENLTDILYLPSSKSKKKDRVEKLALIREYRRYRQVKCRLIEAELTQLKKFLPDAKERNITGSEYALSWTWEHKKYTLKFEKPHKTNSQYQGFKLKKILNVLETGYLWGWGKKNIEDYKNEHDSSRYLGTLFNRILLRRPDFEEPCHMPAANNF